MNCFVEFYMVENRAVMRYNEIVESLVYYQNIFNGGGDINSLLSLPYPLYKDIILKQVEEKKRERKMMEENARNNQLKRQKRRR